MPTPRVPARSRPAEGPTERPFSARLEAEVCTMLFAASCAGLPVRRTELVAPAPRASG